MLDHLILGVADYERSRDFYLAALAPLGMEIVLETEGVLCGFGRERKPEFFISRRERSGPVHLAFRSADRDAVNAFYDAAIKAGATDNGKPGVRELYHPDYYGAFVFDPDGNNVEAVCHRPE
jgi:catechol 2,3-dioxygenase-like lactoylglutathione lyase family enzyme